MEITQALKILGAARVIWIDDCFNETPVQLATLLTNSLETAMACKFQELDDALNKYEIDAADAVASVAQILADLPNERIEEIKATFFRREDIQQPFATGELSAETIAKACESLGVAKEDRWTFEKADEELPGLCALGDADLSYVVDLNEAGGSPIRGLDVLRTLWTHNSAGTAFILTHETNVAGEGKSEIELRDKLADMEGLGLPVCVIAKERLYDKEEDSEAIAEALRTCVKRAGLRRSMHEVLVRARERLQTAVDEAAKALLSIPPEQLECHVFERGYKEGVSELHVVERAITAHLGKQAREFFGVDDRVHSSTKRLRALRAIQLTPVGGPPDPHLRAFREAEIWESRELLNRALTPIACGDVFELDPDEEATKASKRRFVLLGQPCDISLRPEGDRAQDTAFLVPLRKKSASTDRVDPKQPLLPFLLHDEQWACDFRDASVVRLSILDLASFRGDGLVRVDEGHSPPAELLVGQQKVYEERTAPASNMLSDPKQLPKDGAICLNLQLAFASERAFKHIHTAVFQPSSKHKVRGETIEKPNRVTWRLRRCGRIRMPYAAALLDQYTTVMSRQAFDLDYMSPGTTAAGASLKEGVPDAPASTTGAPSAAQVADTATGAPPQAATGAAVAETG